MGFKQKPGKRTFWSWIYFFPVKFRSYGCNDVKKNMFRKIIWVNFVGYNSTRHYIIHNAYISFKVWQLKKTPAFCCWSMLRTTLECFFFDFEISLESNSCPYIFAEYQVAPKSSAISCWPGWHESHDRRVHELEDHWLLGPQQKYSNGRKLSGGVGCCFWGGDGNLLEIRNAQLFWNTKWSFWRKNPTIYRQIWGNMVFLSSEHGNIQLVLGIILVGKEAGSAWNKKGRGFSLFLPTGM